jgi:signal transduction histidine kinase/DNA-binding response OmpR family regulator/CHASE3 domain sensor protein
VEELDRTQLSRRLTSALLMPIVVLGVAGSLLAWRLSQVYEDARWIEHSDRVLAAAFEAQKHILDQETGIRGYLLGKDKVFLQPYLSANPGESLDRLEQLVRDSPTQTEKAKGARILYQQWLTTVQPAAEDKDPLAALPASMMARKSLMDSVRVRLNALIAAEQEVRAIRTAQSDENARWTWGALVGLIGLAGFLIAFVFRRNISYVRDTFSDALDREQAARVLLEKDSWIRAAELELAQGAQGELGFDELAARVLRLLAAKTNSAVGALYVADEGVLHRRAGYAIDTESAPATFLPGQGLVGQAYADKKRLVLKDVPAGYLHVTSATGSHTPVELAILPAIADDLVVAVLELGFMKAAEPRALELLDRCTEVIGVAVRSADYRARLRDLLARTREQAAVLQTQQEEMRVQNEELEEQSRALLEARGNLENQQAELEAANSSMEHQTELLERRNRELVRIQTDLTEKATQLAEANRYKSEFLANMSHELRTPLNSSLILSKILSENKDSNLTPEQIRFAETIHSAGNDLLALINDILDLSKIEAGKMDVHIGQVFLGRLTETLKRTFEPIAHNRSLSFEMSLQGGPSSFDTDGQKLQQILTNLLSNAFKFTEHGGVSLLVGQSGAAMTFRVRDTGIGIPENQKEAIFEVFRQADGTTARKYGGTGLGLAISRDLARLLGGDIVIESEPGRGSTFTLTLPLEPSAAQGGVHEVQGLGTPVPPSAGPMSRKSSRPPTAVGGPSRRVADDRGVVDPARRLVLVIEDDPAFAEILVSLAHELEFRCVVAATGAEGLQLALELEPSAVLLDVNLPDFSGMSVLDRLKRNRATRHIPVHVCSVSDHAQAALEMGAIGYLQKPVAKVDLASAMRRLEATFTRGVRRVLVVEDDPVQRESVCLLLEGEKVRTTPVGTVAEALAELKGNTFDCVVTDLTLPDASGYDLLETLAGSEEYAFPPVIVYTGRSLSADEEQRLRRFSDSIIVKGARSPERLLDEVTLFLHQVEADLPAERQRMLKAARDRDSAFEGRRILIVEDDVRNIFALSSILEPKGAELVIARNGREALEVLGRVAQVDLVLMDMMMPASRPRAPSAPSDGGPSCPSSC